MNKIYFLLLLCMGSHIQCMEFSPIEAHSVEQLNRLAKQHPDNINCQDEHGATPLIYAVGLNDLELIKNFIEDGADIALTTNLGTTARMVAEQLGHFGIASYLLKIEEAF